jgi:hypothetical protein
MHHHHFEYTIFDFIYINSILKGLVILYMVFDLTGCATAPVNSDDYILEKANSDAENIKKGSELLSNKKGAPTPPFPYPASPPDSK